MDSRVGEPQLSHGIPIIRIEIEGMKQSILHAIAARQLVFDDYVKQALDRELTDENIQRMVDREVERSIAAAVHDEVERFYRWGGGRQHVADAVQKQLERYGGS